MSTIKIKNPSNTFVIGNAPYFKNSSNGWLPGKQIWEKVETSWIKRWESVITELLTIQTDTNWDNEDASGGNIIYNGLSYISSISGASNLGRLDGIWGSASPRFIIGGGTEVLRIGCSYTDASFTNPRIQLVFRNLPDVKGITLEVLLNSNWVSKTYNVVPTKSGNISYIYESDTTMGNVFKNLLFGNYQVKLTFL